ncbi:MAG: hypothetical protein CMJ18_08985 [Phycisphaeraceae bacterium]|nr:hypothetical protein [Phycisphaeraceae bacterium]
MDDAAGFIAEGADVGVINQVRPGQSALAAAAGNGFTNVCKLLLEAGADPTRRDEEGRDACDAARRGQHEEVVRLLGG